MKRPFARVLVGGAITLALAGIGMGTATAAPPQQPAPPPNNPPSVWLVPGVDLGPVLGWTTNLPVEALYPVDWTLTQLEPHQ
jgi:hypothetical protein